MYPENSTTTIIMTPCSCAYFECNGKFVGNNEKRTHDNTESSYHSSTKACCHFDLVKNSINFLFQHNVNTYHIPVCVQNGPIKLPNMTSGSPTKDHAQYQPNTLG